MKNCMVYFVFMLSQVEVHNPDVFQIIFTYICMHMYIYVHAYIMPTINLFSSSELLFFPFYSFSLSLPLPFFLSLSISPSFFLSSFPKILIKPTRFGSDFNIHKICILINKSIPNHLENNCTSQFANP